MGRYSRPLAPVFAAFAAIGTGQRVLDVGCGPGALTSELITWAGSTVAAVDPSEPFVAAARERHPTVDVRRAPAEQLPFEDDRFDAVLAQLVVHFMADPIEGLREMRRVARPGGVVAACVWDYELGGAPLSRFWEAAQALDPEVEGESGLAGSREGQLGQYLRQVELREVEEGLLTVHVEHSTFDEWWEPFTLGVGPAGMYTAGLDATTSRSRLRERCRTETVDWCRSSYCQAWSFVWIVEDSWRWSGSIYGPERPGRPPACRSAPPVCDFLRGSSQIGLGLAGHPLTSPSRRRGQSTAGRLHSPERITQRRPSGHGVLHRSVAPSRRAISFPSSQRKKSTTAGTSASAHCVSDSCTVPNSRRRTSIWVMSTASTTRRGRSSSGAGCRTSRW